MNHPDHPMNQEKPIMSATTIDRAQPSSTPAGIVSPNGHALLRMDGAPLPSITIAMNKAFTAAREGKPTMDIGAKFKDRGYDFMWYGDGRYVGWGGGVPVLVNGKCVGAVAVSGLTQQEDHEIAGIGVSAILKS